MSFSQKVSVRVVSESVFICKSLFSAIDISERP